MTEELKTCATLLGVLNAQEKALNSARLHINFLRGICIIFFLIALMSNFPLVH